MCTCDDCFFFPYYRKKVIRASSVAELCDLSHIDDLLTCSITPTYANTISASNNEGGSCTSSSSNCNLGHAPISTNVASTTDHNSQKIVNADVHNSDQSCQDAAGRHKIVKQMSTSSIQVSEGN